MSSAPRWDRCIEHRGPDVRDLVTTYFNRSDRRIMLVGGAGFDPRSRAASDCLKPVASQTTVVLVKEQRPDPPATLSTLADANLAALKEVFPQLTVLAVDIFGQDNAAIGGRTLTRLINELPLDAVTDVIVDLSALSIGTSYPIVKYFCERARTAEPRNVHAFVAADPQLDESIKPIAGDTVDFVHGFRGGWALDENAAAAKLWLPQLARGRKAALQRIHDFIQPHDTCPILPFPASRPRLADELVEQFMVEIESTWQVDTRNLVHASEDDPLDLYRTILRIDDLRRPVFEHVGGSMLVLSPMGSKVLALGALLAALERDIPVAYLEAIGYEVVNPAEPGAQPNMIHLWLEGDVYTGASHA